MAYPASTQALADALASVDRTALRLKQFAQDAKALMAAQNVSGNQLLQIMSEMKSALETWATARAIPGIAAYVRDQKGDQALDLVAEVGAMITAAEQVRDAIIAGFPAHDGYILKDQLGTDGAITVRQFTPAQTAGLRGHLDALIATIG
ncbi:MAG: hypothetical protein IPM60_15495 [Rhodospirillales bacterium]|nr:hypothetical protein [Rhodospirillales bacterium]